jgi:putative solute:sodium symporter small subunit
MSVFSFWSRPIDYWGENFMSSKKEQHWAKTRSLTFTVLVIWAIVSFAIHWVGEGLNSPSFPGAYFMAGMGAQVAFAILVFWFASRQNAIDEEFGLEEK